MASRASSGSIPSPSSSTRTCFLPPSSTWMAMRLAPASIAFSTSSLTTDAGRSTTSPAAIWFARSAGRSEMRPTSDPAPLAEVGEHHHHDDDDHAHHPPELRGVAAWKQRQVHVHPPDAGDERERHENRRHDGEDLHHLVQPVADVREVGVEDAGDPVLEHGRIVRDPLQVIVDVAEAERHVGADVDKVAPRETRHHVPLWNDDPPQPADAALLVEDGPDDLARRVVECRRLEFIEPVLELLH